MAENAGATPSSIASCMTLSARRPRAKSLRRQLLLILLTPLVLIFAIGSLISYHASAQTANEAFDRTLLGAARAIAERIILEDGMPRLDLPAAAFEMLQTDLQDRIFYRVMAPDGSLVSGYEDLPQPPADLSTDTPQFSDSSYRGEPIRLVATVRQLYNPSAAPYLIVQVAETTASRRDLQWRSLRDTLVKELVLIAGAALAISFGVSWTLRPLRQLQQAMQERTDHDLTPVPDASLPTEIQPLAQTLNLQVHRQQTMLDQQRSFLSNASHQLKTPLAVARVKADLALRSEHPEVWKHALTDLNARIEGVSRVVGQLLMLARSEAATPLGREPVDLVQLAQDTTFDWIEIALSRNIDLGFDSDVQQAWILGHPLLLREALANLIHNALEYSGAGSHVTVGVTRAADTITLTVDDNGPGIAADPPDLRQKIFERFTRGGHGGQGCGLGLAIVRDIVVLHQGQIDVVDPPHATPMQPGTRFQIRLPASETPPTQS